MGNSKPKLPHPDRKKYFFSKNLFTVFCAKFDPLMKHTEGRISRETHPKIIVPCGNWGYFDDEHTNRIRTKR